MTTTTTVRESLQLTRRVVFYLNDPLVIAVDQAARSRLTTVSAWMREAVLDRLVAEGHHPPPPLPSTMVHHQESAAA